MKPILFIHGYSSEGQNTPVEEIYGTLPNDLRAEFGDDHVLDLNLSRWISLSDGIALDDISFAMERALRARHPRLLESGFHVVIHSTGALVVRNWIKNYCLEPDKCPIENLVHLAGAHFGSGLAHVGAGQFSRWARHLIFHTRSGVRVLDELMFGSWKSLDLALHFRKENTRMFESYGVQEYCIIGSQTPKLLRHVPIKYIKEDSSDNTVRTSAGNLNFNYVRVTPKPSAYSVSVRKLNELNDQRMNEEALGEHHYEWELQLSDDVREVPFAIAYETAHFGGDIGIVTGSKNRRSVLPLIKTALATEPGEETYQRTTEKFQSATEQTYNRAGKLKNRLVEWNVHEQYEAHSQLIFRIRDQFGNGVKDFDITFRTRGKDRRIEDMIEDRRTNRNHDGTITFYLRTQKYKDGEWVNLLDDVRRFDVEVTGNETESDEIGYVPLQLKITANQAQAILKNLQTTIIDIEMVRLPSQKVFKITHN